MSTIDLSTFSSHLQDKLETLESEYQRWNDFKQDYDALEKQLTTLPDTTSQNAMIPLGKLAFMPGKIIHTNEILVLLGDQYYAERSAKQALGILERRREVVVENLRLAEAQLNALKHKTDSVQSNLYPSGDQLVNEEGLPIMEIREELPPEEPKKKPAIKLVQQTSNALPESVQRARDMMNTKPTETNDEDNKALFDLLRELEEEEEEEEGGIVEIQRQQPRITEIVDDDSEEEEENSDYDDMDDEDRYDMEVSSSMFDRFDDDDEYPYDQVVDQEDFSHHDSVQPQQDEFDEDADRSVPKLTTKKKSKAAALENTVKETSAKESENKSIVQETPVSDKKVSKFKLQRRQQEEKKEEDVVPPVKKVSKFKLARQQEEAEPVKTQVVAESTPAKKVSKFKLARQQQQIKESEPVKDEQEAPTVKKVSKFKLARQQQQEDEPLTDNMVKEKVPSVVSESNLSSQEQERTQEQQTPSHKHTIPEVASSKPKRRFKPTIPSKRRTTKPERKVTWDASTSVREHDHRMAPSAVSETESYSEPVKTEGSNDHTIRSPADIFRVVKQTQMQQQQQDDDEYPSFDQEEESEPIEVDLNELVKVARSVPQNLWRSNDGSEMMIPMPMNDDDYEEEEEEKGIIIANKNKLDTNVMRGAVMERETKPVNIEEVEDDMDLKEITSFYQQKRQSMLAATGGFSFDPKPEFEVIDEDLPLPKDKEEEEEEEEEVVPKKMSRFKAARLGMKKNEMEY
ncbi:hypothetical protein K501DRAFT_330480 [Backusella circina FSU 941]|nr:hypothetical protein K501DRAFT_330480 [Backusella circina FSU 941]